MAVILSGSIPINDLMKGNHQINEVPLVIASAIVTLVQFLPPSMTMEKLRVVAECWPPNIYYDSFSNGTEWHGNGMWTLQEMRGLLPPIEVVTNLSKSEDTFDAIQTLYDNRADMSTDKWGITHERSKLVDFSYSLKVYGTYLYSSSGAKNAVLGDPVRGVFDATSYALFLVTLVLVILGSNSIAFLKV